jgi:nicotinate-nucleotide pyrophosphorylase (carboxylating)
MAVNHGNGMTFDSVESQACQVLVNLALREDLGDAGDITSRAIVDDGARGTVICRAREAGIIAGLDAFAMVFRSLDASANVTYRAQDGQHVSASGDLATVHGRVQTILAGERSALNFLQHLSGIASLTARFVAAVAGTRATILDTRKTFPGWRRLEKYAVRCGGGSNHRIGLYDAVLIKDNHLAALGGARALPEAMQRVRSRVTSEVPMIIEVDDLEALEAALHQHPRVVLLDNFSVSRIREAVKRRDAMAPAVLLEVSGGVTLANVQAIANTGVDRISVGALTHSAPALDIGLDFET